MIYKAIAVRFREKLEANLRLAVAREHALGHLADFTAA
jgi:hypothetical protein